MINKGRDFDAQGLGNEIIKSAQVMVWSQIEPNFFACLSFCGFAQIGVTRFNSTAGKGDISGPRVALCVGALDKEQLRAFTFLQDCGDGAAWFFGGDRSACGECAVVEMCRAHAELDDPARLPTKVRKPTRPHYEVTAGVIWKGSKLLVAQRPSDGMLGGLWEFPGGKREPGESLQECLRREIQEELTIDIEVGGLLAKVDHGYSHFSITLNLFEAMYRGGEPEAVECDDWRWIDPAELDGLPMPRADRRALEELSEERGQRVPVLMAPVATKKRNTK